MAGELNRLRDKPGETEKITINLGFVDLGHIDLLVQGGLLQSHRLDQDGDPQPARRSRRRRQAIHRAADS
jgi:hypothetical protein